MLAEFNIIGTVTKVSTMEYGEKKVVRANIATAWIYRGKLNHQYINDVNFWGRHAIRAERVLKIGMNLWIRGAIATMRNKKKNQIFFNVSNFIVLRKDPRSLADKEFKKEMDEFMDEVEYNHESKYSLTPPDDPEYDDHGVDVFPEDLDMPEEEY